MMKGLANFGWVIVVALILGAVVLGSGIFGETFELLPGFCQNIYGYFPSFRCCDEVEGAGGSYSFGNSGWWECPTYSTKCEVIPRTLSGVFNLGWYRGRTNCAGSWFGQFWCDDATAIPLNQMVELQNQGLNLDGVLDYIGTFYPEIDEPMERFVESRNIKSTAQLIEKFNELILRSGKSLGRHVEPVPVELG